MIVAKIIGNVVSTIKAAGYESKKILIVQPITPNGSYLGKSFLAIDTIQAGIGDIVLVLDEGNSARTLLNEPDSLTVKTVIVGIVDHISIS